MMDLFSIGIIITCLSAGTFLVYLFKVDFERRHQLQHQSSTSNKQAQSHKKVTNNKTTKSSQQQQSLNSTSKSTTTVKKQVPQAEYTVSNNVDDIPKDELDSSILMEVFKPNASVVKSPTQPKTTKKQQKDIDSHHQESKHSRKVAYRVVNDVDQIFHDSSAKNTSYSAEQLLKMIATMNLSKDEVELAVETLLNKLDSTESNWKQPKSDPMQRLKNQNRELESALLMETHNHDQTKKRLSELKSQLQNERISTSNEKEELTKLKEELSSTKQRLEHTQKYATEEYKAKVHYRSVVQNYDEKFADLENKLRNSGENEELEKLRKELESTNHSLMVAKTYGTNEYNAKNHYRDLLNEKENKLKEYELSNKAMSEKIQELDVKLHKSEMNLENLRSMEQRKDEALAKIGDLEEINSSLEKSLRELELINKKQEDMLIRHQNDREANEESMKQTLTEMEKELKELQARLSTNLITKDEKLRVEKELNDADQREQKLVSEMKELREGLSALLPEDIKNTDLKINGDDWIRQYLNAFKQLAITVEELKTTNLNNNNNISGEVSSLECMETRKSVNKSTTTPETNRRPQSPISNGRASKAGSHGQYNGDKKHMETKLLETDDDYLVKLEEELKNLKIDQQNQIEAHQQSKNLYEQQLKDMKLHRSKLEAQIKFGLDSLKMEQERVRALEEQLSNHND